MNASTQPAKTTTTPRSGRPTLTSCTTTTEPDESDGRDERRQPGHHALGSEEPEQGNDGEQDDDRAGRHQLAQILQQFVIEVARQQLRRLERGRRHSSPVMPSGRTAAAPNTSLRSLVGAGFPQYSWLSALPWVTRNESLLVQDRNTPAIIRMAPSTVSAIRQSGRRSDDSCTKLPLVSVSLAPSEATTVNGLVTCSPPSGRGAESCTWTRADLPRREVDHRRVEGESDHPFRVVPAELHPPRPGPAAVVGVDGGRAAAPVADPDDARFHPQRHRFVRRAAVTMIWMKVPSASTSLAPSEAETENCRVTSRPGSGG